MGLSTLEINNLCSHLRKKQIFLGVFSDDKLPMQILNVPYAFIANTDPSTLPGTHWVAVWVHNRNEVWYFDSLNGVPTDAMRIFLDKFKVIKSNNKEFQSFLSDNCGHFCIAFVYYAYTYKSFDRVMKVFNSLGTKLEKFVLNFVHSFGYRKRL